jgi:hypothetical protein
VIIRSRSLWVVFVGDMQDGHRRRILSHDGKAVGKMKGSC